MSDNCTHECGSCSQNCSSRTEDKEAGASSTGGEPDFTAHLHAKSTVKKVIGIVSGKGGVGKSLVTSLLAAQMQKKGFHAAVLDADITGPSIPKAFGLHDKAMGMKKVFTQ